VGSLDPVRIADVLEVSKLPTHEPSEIQGHEELDADGTEDEDEREVKDDIGSDTTNRDGIDESNLNNVDEALEMLIVIGSLDQRGNVLTRKRLVSSRHGVEELREADLNGRKPLEQRHVKDGTKVSILSGQGYSRFVDGQISRLVPDLTPSVVDLGGRFVGQIIVCVSSFV
jgi:hypothetical protein